MQSGLESSQLRKESRLGAIERVARSVTKGPAEQTSNRTRFLCYSLEFSSISALAARTTNLGCVM